MRSHEEINASFSLCSSLFFSTALSSVASSRRFSLYMVPVHFRYSSSKRLNATLLRIGSIRLGERPVFFRPMEALRRSPIVSPALVCGPERLYLRCP